MVRGLSLGSRTEKHRRQNGQDSRKQLPVSWSTEAVRNECVLFQGCCGILYTIKNEHHPITVDPICVGGLQGTVNELIGLRSGETCVPVPDFPSFVTLGKSLDVSEPQFPHL